MRFEEKVAKKLQKKYGINQLDIAIVVGSGLLDGVPSLNNEKKVLYSDLNMPKSKVKGHSGSFVFGEYCGKNVVLVSRMHYYENGDIQKVKMPFQIIKLLGVKTVILLTSSGGLNKSYNVGDIMLINDHINMTGTNPLIGIDNLIFTNMIDCYDIEYKKSIKEIARKNNIELKEGIFCQMSGPSYETMAEVEMLRKLGADSVSMSTAHDCIISRYLDIRVLGISVIVNVYEKGLKEVTHDEVLENALKSSKNLKILLEGFIKKI